MTRSLHSPALRHPERIHPSLWRGSQLAPAFRKAVPSGYPDLDTQLPGRGWPAGSLIEILAPHPGIGEIQLLKPALMARQDERNIIMLNPPHTPSSLCLQQWFSNSQDVLWVRSDSTSDTLWAAEKILQHNTSFALLCWFDAAHTARLHRLHLAARQSSTLFFCFRPASLASQASVASLRLGLEPAPWGLSIRILKRQGPMLKNCISIELYPSHTDETVLPKWHHDTLDQHPSFFTKQQAANTESRGYRPAAIHA